jgi:hypothetical protein
MDNRRQERRQHILTFERSGNFPHLIRDLLQERYNVATTKFVPNIFA